MDFKQSDMLYDDGSYYKWQAKADHDNPYYIKGADHSELNPTEGYEILYYINHLGKILWKEWPGTQACQKMERMIRYSVPKDIRTHKKIEGWIVANWKTVGY